MATDGVNIIDGDSAHDTYWSIMNLYDDGATIKTIRKKISFKEENPYDAFDYEIHTTAYALAIWEIGGMTTEILEEIKSVIAKGACVKVWTEECDEESGKARQEVLNKFWQKISTPNLNIRERKTYTYAKNTLQINDVLTFRLQDGYYCATIVLDVHKYRGEHSYHFGKITYKQKTKPTIEKIKELAILGNKIPSGTNMDIQKLLSIPFEEMLRQGGIDEILKKEAEKTESYVLGMAVIAVTHENFQNIKNNFEVIGNLPLNPICKNGSSLSVSSNFKDFTESFVNLYEDMKFHKFKIKEFIEI